MTKKKDLNLNKWETPKKKEYEITHNQFCNILAFIVIFANNYDVINQSPDYVIEKYARYIGNPEEVKASSEYKKGVHVTLKKALIEPYSKRWNIQLRKMKILSILKEE